MRTLLLATALSASLGVAHAQMFAHEPGTGMSGPASTTASNTDAANTRSPIAPHFPSPMGGDSQGPWRYLHDADRDLRMHKTGAAQQALEMAETRLLDRSTPAGAANQPDQGQVVQQVSQARQALGNKDIAGARAAIRMALASEHGGAMGGGAMGAGAMNAPMSPGMTSTSTSTSTSTQVMSHPGGAPMGNGTAATMAPSGAGAAPGNTAGAAAGGGPAGVGTTDSAGGAK